MSQKLIQGEVIGAEKQVLPEEYENIQRVKDLWANGVEDLTIRGLLGMSMTAWRELLKLMKELDNASCDNHVAYLKYQAKNHKRSQELDDLRLFAQSTGEINSAIKAFQLASDLDKQNIEIGQKLGVLAGEVLRIEKFVKSENSVEVLFASIPEEKRIEAEEELMQLTRQMLIAGVEFGTE